MLCTCPQGLFIFSKTPSVYLALPQGLFIFPQNSVFVFSAPAGAFILLKKSIFVLNTPPGASQSSSRSSQSWLRPAGPPERPGVVPGGALPTFWLKVREGLSKMKVSEFSRLSRLSRLSRGSGGSRRASDPTFHTRRGSGWRELRTNSLKLNWIS